MGVGCPTGMTYAGLPWSRAARVRRAGVRRSFPSRYDKRPLALHVRRPASTIGYAMTEKQGGSDLRQTQTTARFLESTSEGRAYLLNGHKWFFSVPQSDGFFTLAQTRMRA